MASRHSSSDDDEDFGPLLPGMQLQAQTASVALDSSYVAALKREREDNHKDDSGENHSHPPLPQHLTEEEATTTAEVIREAPLPATAAEPAVDPASGAPVDTQAATKDDAWEIYKRQQLPCAALYERSFQHTSLQETYDALAAKAKSSDKHAVAPVARAVHDVCVHHDSLGALIATVDAAGVVRVWRKLPRSVFFVTELDKVFGAPRRNADAASAAPCNRTYWAHAYTALQLLVFVCVEEDLVEPREVSAQLRTVRVHLRQINPVTFTVEERHAFSFQVPLQPVATLDMVDVKAAQRTSNQHRAPSPLALAYTRRPTFLTHQYQPHIAFFVSLPAAATGTSTSSSMTGGSGVVLCPCFPSPSAPSHKRFSGATASADAAGTLYAPTRLSVANPIVYCTQRAVSLERTGTAPCVLLDSSGVLDYCTIEADTASSAAESAGAAAATSSGLTLRVIAGLAAVPATSREGRLWRQWVRFERRQRTGFFCLLRDAQQALQLASSRAEAADVQVIPCAVDFTPDGLYVVVWSVRLTRSAGASLTQSTGKDGQARQSRIPSTQRVFTLTAESCLHVLEFASGACVGRHTERLADADVTTTTEEDISVKPSDWAEVVRLRSRCLAAQMVVVEGAAAAAGAASAPAAAPRWYILVPEVSCAHLLVGDAAASTTVREEGVNSPYAAAAMGQRISVYEAAGVDGTSISVRRLPHSPGEWEPLLRRARRGSCSSGGMPLPSTHAPSLRLKLSSSVDALERLAASGSDNGIQERSGGHPFHCRAPLLLLRRAVAPSQDLKNLIAASPLGAALGAESRKQLFLAPDAVEGGLILTTSFDADAAALLVYGSALPYSGLALQRRILNGAASSTEGASELLIDAQQHQQQQQQQWENVCVELHHERDFACGALLMTTVAPPSDEAGGTASPATTAGGGAAPSLTAMNAADTETKEHEGGEGSASTATSTTRGSAARVPPPPSSPEAFILHLLKDVIPEQGSSANTARSSPPTALVHVRGYGTVRVHLLPHIAPLASESFLRLSRRHYYDRLTFHRVIPRVIVQGGCPRGDGTGGESAFDSGAPFQDEALHIFPFFSHTADPKCCWLCMANAGPNTNGSQFFFTVPGGEAMPWLNGHHTVFGYAVDGLDVVRAMSMAARNGEDKPLSPIIMERIDVLSG